MEDFSEEHIQEIVLHGEKNQRTAQRITNWCRNARIARSGGIGMVEQMTGVPIGHMGIECDHAPESGMHCWDLEDAAINFYLANCEHCDKRSPGTGQSIEPLIQDYKRRELERREAETNRKADEARRQGEQLATLARLRIPGEDLGNQIVDLLVAIVGKNDEKSSDALVELATLAPETFSSEIVEFLRAQVSNANDRLEIPALRTLLELPLEEKIKRQLAIKNARKRNIDESSAKHLQEFAYYLSSDEIEAVLPNFALLARPVSGFPHMQRQPNSGPLLAIAAHHPEDTKRVINNWLSSSSPHLVDTAFRVISVLTVPHSNIVEPFLRDVLSKLLRRTYLLPKYQRDSASDRLQVLRGTARRLFRRFPKTADSVLQSLLEGAADTAKSEAARVYSGVLEKEWNEVTAGAGQAEEIAFTRILWMAVDDPIDSLDGNATHFFSHVHSDLLPIAANHVEAILGAAATLSSKLNEQNPHELLAVPTSGMEELERTHRRNAIYLFQGNLIKWAFEAVALQGLFGIRLALEFYEALPQTETEMRANVVEHLSKLMKNSATVNEIIPHLYGAMTSPEALIRGSAARALGEVSHEVRRDLPDLVFEVYLVLLSDPNVFVHKTAARCLKVYDFPERLKTNVALSLLTLIRVYQRTEDDQMFVADLLRKYVHGCLTDTQLSGNHGGFVVAAISQLDDVYARNALDSLGQQLTFAPGIVQLCIKMLGNSIAEYHGQDKILQVLDDVPVEVLESHAKDLGESAPAFASTRPHFTNSLIALLAKAACWGEATEVCTRVLSNIGDTRRERVLRYHYESLRQVCEFESVRATEGISISKAKARWSSLQREKKDEEAERDARESFRPFFFQ